MLAVAQLTPCWSCRRWAEKSASFPQLRAWVFEVDALYKPERFDHLQFLAGVRSLEMNLKAQLAGNTLGVGSRQWVDPVVGAVYSRPISDRWFFTVRGDLGGFGISSDMTVNAFGVVGFNTSQNTSLLFGYRYTTYDFEEPDFTPAGPRLPGTP